MEGAENAEKVKATRAKINWGGTKKGIGNSPCGAEQAILIFLSWPRSCEEALAFGRFANDNEN